MTTAIGFPPTLRGQQIKNRYSDGYRNSSKSPERRHQVSSNVVVNNLSPKTERSPPSRNNIDNKPSIIEGKFEHLPWHMIAVGVLLEEDENNNENDDDFYNTLNDSNSTISLAADVSLLGPNIECYTPDRSLYNQQQQQNMLLPPLPKYQQQSKHKQASPTTSPLRQQQRQQQNQQQRMVTDNNISMASTSITAASSSSPPSAVHIDSTIVPSSNSPLPRYQPEQHHHNQQKSSMLPPLPKYQPPQQQQRTGQKMSLPPTSTKQKQQKKKAKTGRSGQSVVSSSPSSVVDDDSIIAPSSVAGNEAATRKSHSSVASSTTTTTFSSHAYSTEDLQNKLYEFAKVVEVKDNRYRMRRYKNTFVGSEAVDALIKHNVASTRTDAVILGRLLSKKYNLFKHVCDDHLFKDEHLFYRYNT